MRVLITDSTHPVLTEKLEAAGHQCRVWTDCTYDTLLDETRNYDALVVRSKIIIDRNFIDHNRHLKCIGRVGAGMETIDVDYAESVGIRCLNSPEGNRDAVGEHATGLLLALFDKICVADSEMRNGLWQREANRGLEVKGKTVGIIGFGNMGGAFAQRLQGFECKIVAYDKYKLAGYAPAYVKEVSLEQLQRQADIVSLHVPLTDETHYMVDSKFIDAFEKPFYLINTSRGAVVKTSDLATAMEQGKVLGAALDVIEYEDMTKDGLGNSTGAQASSQQERPAPLSYLLGSPRTVLTPHVAGWTVESKYKLAAVLADKIIETLC